MCSLRPRFRIGAAALYGAYPAGNLMVPLFHWDADVGDGFPVGHRWHRAHEEDDATFRRRT